MEMAELVQKLCQCKVVDCKWVELAWDGSVTNRDTHRRFRGSVKCGAPSMENRVQVAKYLLEVRMASSLVCLVQNGPGVIRVACICLGDAKKKHHGPPGPPNFHDFHIWTDSLEQATLDVIH